MNPRTERLLVFLQRNNLDGLLITHQPNITYLIDSPSSDSYLLVTRRDNFFITDGRYYQQAISHLKDFNVILGGKSVFKTIAKLVSEAGVRRLGFEDRYLDVARYNQIKSTLDSIELISAYKLVERLRHIKEPSELTKIRKAVDIASGALRFIERLIQPGISELEIVAELQRLIIRKGAWSSAFEPIVASGTNSAFPHHLSSKRKLKSGECLLIDIGADYEGYKSDLTRTFFLGKIPPLFRKIYNIVRQAQLRTIANIRPGVKFCEIDKSARQYIARHGYGGFFTHNIGHGIGLEIHEEPYISQSNKTVIRKGMVFTIEPGIYLPGKFGIRIEDDILVTEKGCEILSGYLNK